MKKIVILFILFRPLCMLSQTDTIDKSGKDTTIVAIDSSELFSKDPSFEIITNEDVKLKVFPNPTSGNTTLRLQLRAPQFFTIDITDANNNVIKTVLAQNFNGADQSVLIDTKGLRTGSYLLRVLSEGGNVIASTVLNIQR